jgi:hypothetical protein
MPIAGAGVARRLLAGARQHSSGDEFFGYSMLLPNQTWTRVAKFDIRVLQIHPRLRGYITIENGAQPSLRWQDIRASRAARIGRTVASEEADRWHGPRFSHRERHAARDGSVVYLRAPRARSNVCSIAARSRWSAGTVVGPRPQRVGQTTLLRLVSG